MTTKAKAESKENYGKEVSKKSTERKQTIATTQHVQCVISISHFLSVLI